MDTEAQSIVDRAVALGRSDPSAPALDILDLTMTGRHGSHPSFEAGPLDGPFGDWTDPSSPFGDLLRRAFADGEIDDGAAALWVSEDPVHGRAHVELQDLWQKVVD